MHKKGNNRDNSYAYETEEALQRHFGIEKEQQGLGHRNDGRLIKSGIAVEIKTTNTLKKLNSFWGSEYASHFNHTEDFILILCVVTTQNTETQRHLDSVVHTKAFYIDHLKLKELFSTELVDYFNHLKVEWIRTGKHPDPNGKYNNEWKQCQQYVKAKWATPFVSPCLKKEHHGNQFRLQCSISRKIFSLFEELQEIDGIPLNTFIGKKIAGIDFTPKTK